MIDAVTILADHLDAQGDHKRAERVRERDCGTCSACCQMGGRRSFLPHPLDKLDGPCPLLDTRGGCSIYQTRPETCQQYLCGWRAGLGASDDRPDISGWIVDITGDQPPFTARAIRTKVVPDEQTRAVFARFESFLGGLRDNGELAKFEVIG